MALLGTVLLWVLRVLLALLALALLLVLAALLLPAQVKLSYSPAGLRFWAGALGLRLQLLPQNKKPAPKKEKEQPAPAPQPPQPAPDKAEKKTGQPAAKKPVDVKRLLGSLPALLDMAGSFLRAVLRSLRFHHLVIVVPVSGGAPDKVARNVGKANAWFYAIASALESGLRLAWQQVNIFPDYDGTQKDALLLEVTVTGQLLPIVIAAVWLLLGLRREKIL